MWRFKGDKFIVTKNFSGRDRVDRIPEDIVGRVGTLIECDGAWIKLSYPNGALLRDGSTVGAVEIVENDDKYGLEKVKLITDGHKLGPHDGTVMLDVEPLYNSFWGRFKKKDTRRSHNGHLEEVTASIKKDGLRHPIILNRNMELRVGAYRLAAYHALGKDKIEAYITDTDKKRSWRL
jgi:hypothetical protein